MVTAHQFEAAERSWHRPNESGRNCAQLVLPTHFSAWTSGGVIRGNVHSLMRVIEALEALGVELIGEGSSSNLGGRGVRLRDREVQMSQMSREAAVEDGRMSVGLSACSTGLRRESTNPANVRAGSIITHPPRAVVALSS